MDTRNPDPDTILLLQKIAMLADRKKTDVILRPEGLLLRRIRITRQMEEMISWLEMRNVVGGPLWLVESHLDHMIQEMGE